MTSARPAVNLQLQDTLAMVYVYHDYFKKAGKQEASLFVSRHSESAKNDTIVPSFWKNRQAQTIAAITDINQRNQSAADFLRDRAKSARNQRRVAAFLLVPVGLAGGIIAFAAREQEPYVEYDWRGLPVELGWRDKGPNTEVLVSAGIALTVGLVFGLSPQQEEETYKAYMAGEVPGPKSSLNITASGSGDFGAVVTLALGFDL